MCLSLVQGGYVITAECACICSERGSLCNIMWGSLVRSFERQLEPGTVSTLSISLGKNPGSLLLHTHKMRGFFSSSSCSKNALAVRTHTTKLKPCFIHGTLFFIQRCLFLFLGAGNNALIKGLVLLSALSILEKD